MVRFSQCILLYNNGDSTLIPLSPLWTVVHDGWGCRTGKRGVCCVLAISVWCDPGLCDLHTFTHIHLTNITLNVHGNEQAVTLDIGCPRGQTIHVDCPKSTEQNIWMVTWFFLLLVLPFYRYQIPCLSVQDWGEVQWLVGMFHYHSSGGSDVLPLGSPFSDAALVERAVKSRPATKAHRLPSACGISFPRREGVALWHPTANSSHQSPLIWDVLLPWTRHPNIPQYTDSDSMMLL